MIAIVIVTLYIALRVYRALDAMVREAAICDLCKRR